MAKKSGSVRRALVLSFAQRYTDLAFNIATVLIVSRLLTPAEIGVFSVAAGLTALFGTLRDFGVTEYLIQEQSLDRPAIHTAFTVTLLTAWIMAAVLLLASEPIGRLYGDMGVSQVIKVLSINLALIPFGSITMAMLRRNLEYGALYRIRAGETATRSAMTIGLAWAGFGYMSMAWGALAAMVANIIGCTVWGWRYRVRGVTLAHWRQVLPFGSKRIIVDVVGQLGAQSANIVIGKMLGMAEAGYYSRGYSVINMFRSKVMSAVGSVAFPAMARAHREKNAAPAYFLNVLVHIAAICWPFFAFAAIMAPSMVFAFFGDQWAVSVPIMRWLCVAAMFGTLIFQCSSFLTAIGRVGQVAIIQIQYQLARLGLAIVAATYSLEAVAASQIVVYLIAITLYYRQFLVYDALRPGKIAMALVPSAAVTVASCAMPVAMVLLWPEFMHAHQLAGLILAAFGAGAGWMAGLSLTKHPLWFELRQALTLFAGRLRSVSGLR